MSIKPSHKHQMRGSKKFDIPLRPAETAWPKKWFSHLLPFKDPLPSGVTETISINLNDKAQTREDIFKGLSDHYRKMEQRRQEAQRHDAQFRPEPPHTWKDEGTYSLVITEVEVVNTPNREPILRVRFDQEGFPLAFISGEVYVRLWRQIQGLSHPEYDPSWLVRRGCTVRVSHKLNHLGYQVCFVQLLNVY